MKSLERIELTRADITQLQVEAIVNAANSSLRGGGGVDGAIHRAAGPELLAECRTLDGCPPGEARLTGGYRLPAKFVIHTVGPVWHGGHHREPEFLASCYRECFRLARDRQIRTMAFPAISCGAFGYPVPAAASIALRESVAALDTISQIDRVFFACFSEDVYNAYKTEMNRLSEAGGSH